MANYRTTVTCRKCGKKVPIADAEKHFHRRSKTPSGFDYTCKECKERAAGQRETSSSRIRLGRKTPKTLNVNGCSLVPAIEGVRCGDYLKCEHYEDCLDRVAVLGWPGWTIKGVIMNIIALIKRNIDKGKQPPELHACPHCGAPLTRLQIIHGGIIRFGTESRVKATIACRDCKRIHVHRGNKVADHWLIMTIMNQGRRSVA